MLMRTVLMLLAIGVSALARGAAPPVLQGEQITESAVVDALAGPKPVTTRGIGRDSGGAARKPVAASLLITFETNAAALTGQARRELQAVAHALNTDTLSAFKFVIEGHADPRGAPQANLRLSQARAQAVREFLIGAGVSESRLNAVGKGDTEPLNTDNPAAPENRRVTFVNLFNAQ